MKQCEAKGILKHIDCVKAFAEGKIIQTKDAFDDWCDESNPCWYLELEYRIKPEKKIVPYENGDEFYNDWCSANTFIKRKEAFDRNPKYLPMSIYDDGVTLGGSFVSWKYLLENFVFGNNTPCGKLVEE